MQSLVLLDAFVSAIKVMWSQLRKSVADVTLGAITNILENRVRTENYHVKSKEWSERKKMPNVRQDTEAEILSPYTKWEVKRKMFGKCNPWK